MIGGAITSARALLAGAATVLALQAGILVVPASAQYSSSQSYQSYQWQDAAIKRAFRDVLRREPDQQGLRHYRMEMIDNGWTEQDVRRALVPEIAAVERQLERRIPSPQQSAYQVSTARVLNVSGIVGDGVRYP